MNFRQTADPHEPPAAEDENGLALDIHDVSVIVNEG